jgi:Heterokaryon incompatibility protein (HET)
MASPNQGTSLAETDSDGGAADSSSPAPFGTQESSEQLDKYDFNQRRRERPKLLSRNRSTQSVGGGQEIFPINSVIECAGCNQVLPPSLLILPKMLTEKTIAGPYFQCLEYQSWNYCSTCGENRTQIHPMHTFSWVSTTQQDLLVNSPAAPLQATPMQGSHSSLSTGKNPAGPNQAPKASSMEEGFRDILSGLKQCPATVIGYEYTTLEAETSATRLLVLMPGEPDSPIHVRILPISLNDETPSYEALSYAWGDHISVDFIFLDEQKRCVIRKNLHAGLVRLRYMDRPRYLWIDAISINQADDLEKGSQVQLMPRIYQQASRVIIWLGESADDSGLVMDYVQHRSQFDDREIDLSPRMFNAFLQLCQRSWWRRVWCLQELVLSKEGPVVMCGNRVVPWHSFSTMVDKWHREFRSSAFPVRRWQILEVEMACRTSPFFHIRNDFHTHELAMPLESLLRNTISLESSDARDKVYGILGVASKEDQKALQADYTKSTTEVYTDVMMHCFQRSGKLDLLCFNTNSPSAEKRSNPLPSWVSDWTLLSSQPRPIHRFNLYNACKGSLAVIERSDDPALLRVAGIPFDYVREASEPILGLLGPKFAPRKWRETFKQLGEMLKRTMTELIGWNTSCDRAELRRYVNLHPDSRVSDHFWRTVLANQYLCGSLIGSWSRPAPAKWAEMYEILAYGPGSTRQTSKLLEDAFPAGSEMPEMPKRLQTPEPSTIPEDFCPDLSLEDRMAHYTSPFAQCIVLANGRRLFVTQAGYMGIASKEVQHGDMVAVLDGCDMPVILRYRKDRENFRFISEAYVHELMDGQAVDIANQKGCEKGIFVIG